MPQNGNQQPLVTIGVPVRNGARFLKDVFDALLAQDFEEFEILVSDNASNDETGNICRQYQKRDPRVRYVRQESNLGAVGNFNFLLSQARGKYFMFAAADDLWKPQFLSRAITVFEKDQGIAVVYPRFEYIDEEGKVTSPANKVEYDIHNTVLRLIAFAWLYRDHVFYGLMRTELIKDARLSRWWWPNQDVYIDIAYPFLCQILSRGRVVSVPCEPLFQCRIWPHEYEGEKLFPRSFWHYLLLKVNVLVESLRAIHSGTNSFVIPALVAPTFLMRFLIEISKGTRYPKLWWREVVVRRVTPVRIWLEQHVFWRWMRH